MHLTTAQSTRVAPIDKLSTAPTETKAGIAPVRTQVDKQELGQETIDAWLNVNAHLSNEYIY